MSPGLHSAGNDPVYIGGGPVQGSLCLPRTQATTRWEGIYTGSGDRRADGTAASNFPTAPEPAGIAFSPSAPTATVQVCKVAGTGVLVGTAFTFNVGGTVTTVKAGPSPGGASVRRFGRRGR